MSEIDLELLKKQTEVGKYVGLTDTGPCSKGAPPWIPYYWDEAHHGGDWRIVWHVDPDIGDLQEPAHYDEYLLIDLTNHPDEAELFGLEETPILTLVECSLGFVYGWAFKDEAVAHLEMVLWFDGVG